MTPAERTAKIAELRAEADRLEREGERNWPERLKTGDQLTIKTPDAPEPTGAELVGKVCEFSDYGFVWSVPMECIGCDLFSEDHKFRAEDRDWYRFARLAKDQP